MLLSRILAPLAGLALALPAAGGLGGPTLEREERIAKPETVAAGWLEARWTKSDLERLAAAVEARVRDAGPLPAGAGLEVLAPDYLPPARAKDPWGTAYRLAGGASPAVESAGPDRRFGSADDLRRPLRLDGGGVRPPATDPAPLSAPPAAAAAAPRRSAPAPPQDPRQQATLARMAEIASALADFKARAGRYPEQDDAVRLVRMLGLELPAEDAWGRKLSYLSFAGGSRCILLSRGPDGRLDHSLEDSLAGAAPRDDLVMIDTGSR